MLQDFPQDGEVRERTRVLIIILLILSGGVGLPFLLFTLVNSHLTGLISPALINLLLVNSWERAVVVSRKLPDTSERGDGSAFRNAKLAGHGIAIDCAVRRCHARQCCCNRNIRRGVLVRA